MHSPLIVCVTIPLLISLGTCIVQIQSVWVNLACTKRFFNLSAEAIINARKAQLRARCAILRLTITQIFLSCRLAKGIIFLKRVQNQFKMLLEMYIVSTERNANQRCNKSETHLWLWKMWSLVACSQSTFCVTRAPKDHKNRQHKLSICYKK